MSQTEYAVQVATSTAFSLIDCDVHNYPNSIDDLMPLFVGALAGVRAAIRVLAARPDRPIPRGLRKRRGAMLGRLRA